MSSLTRKYSNPSTPLRIVLADDHLVLQTGLVSLLRQEPDFVCAGVTQTGNKVIELVERENPDVLVIDLSMPGLPVLPLVRHLRETVPALHIIILTMHATPFAMAEAFKAGAHAFIAKEDSFSVLASSIRRVCAGESGFHSDILNAVQVPHVTPREREVLYYLARGWAGKEIGAHLEISDKTMEMYRTRLFKKFKVTKATELVRIALESGVLQMTPSRRSDLPP
jgi:DNA-binding NarL/FixJ family response regulator